MINRVNANDNFNVQEGTSCCILQHTTLGLLLFNVSINDMLIFFKACGMCNYANGKTFYMPMREMSTKFKGRQNENLRDQGAIFLALTMSSLILINANS